MLNNQVSNQIEETRVLQFKEEYITKCDCVTMKKMVK